MLDWFRSLPQSGANAWNRSTPMQRFGYGMGGLTMGAGLLGLIQQMRQGRPVNRTEITRAVGEASPAERQLAQMYQQRVQAIPTPETILNDPAMQARFAGAFSGAGGELERQSLENLRQRGFTGQTSGIDAYGGARANLASEVNKAMLQYALQAPQAYAQAGAPMGDLLSQMQNFRMNAAPQMQRTTGPKPGLLGALQAARPVFEMGGQAMDYASRIPRPGQMQGRGIGPVGSRMPMSFPSQYRGMGMGGGMFPPISPLSAPNIDYGGY